MHLRTWCGCRRARWSPLHFKADLTLGLGSVAFDYFGEVNLFSHVVITGLDPVIHLS
jgi:hypothetical protein